MSPVPWAAPSIIRGAQERLSCLLSPTWGRARLRQRPGTGSHVRSESAESPRAPASLPLPPPAPGHMEPLTRDGACRREAPSEAKAAKMNHSEEGHVSPARECENRRPGSLSDMKNKGERQGEVGAGQPDPAGLRVQGHKSKVPVTELGTARGRDGQGYSRRGAEQSPLPGTRDPQNSLGDPQSHGEGDEGIYNVPGRRFRDEQPPTA